ncbi:hypothetical protein HK101_009725, partial [Irineochytrium annulatum]
DNIAPDGEAWNDEELYLLLEGVEIFEDDWARIAEHVGTRTKDQCILRFLQMPIEDQYLETYGVMTESIGELLQRVDAELKDEGERGLRLKRGAFGRDGADSSFGQLPFTAAENPTMAIASLLSSFVSSDLGRMVGKVVIRKADENKEMKAKSSRIGKTLGVGTHSYGTNGLAADNGSKPSGFMEGKAPESSGMNADQGVEARRMLFRYHHLESQRLHLKLQQFFELDALVEQERAELEKERKQLILDRIGFRSDIANSLAVAIDSQDL